MQGAYGLALVGFAMDRADVVDAAIATVREYAQQTDNRAAYREVQLFETYLAAGAGGLNVANPLRADGRRFRAVPVVTLFAPPLATAALLLRQEVPAALDAAAALLQEMTQYFNATHMTLHYVTGRVLQARLLALRGMRPDALAVLAEALELAQRGDLRLPFIENGAVLYELLGELNLAGASLAFAEDLRALILAGDGTAGSRRAAVPTAAAKPVAPPLRLPQPHHPDLLELLTIRELEVLQLLALRMTNKEIAQRLCISTGTVKQHTINVYRKLHVENRREAIVQAQMMGFHLQTPYSL
jgi:LuxR family maltose regulon positive regulatory protein